MRVALILRSECLLKKLESNLPPKQARAARNVALIDMDLADLAPPVAAENDKVCAAIAVADEAGAALRFAEQQLDAR